MTESCLAEVDAFQLAPVLSVLTHQLIYQVRVVGRVNMRSVILSLLAGRGHAPGVIAVDAHAAVQDSNQGDCVVSFQVAIASLSFMLWQLYRLIDDIAPVLLKTLAESTQSSAVCACFFC